jgi:hypothetical protein
MPRADFPADDAMLRPGGDGSDDRATGEPQLDYRDPSAGVWGAPPAASALRLRAWLAATALAGCVAGIIATAVRGGPVVLIAVLSLVGLTALVDSVVIAARRRRERPAR